MTTSEMISIIRTATGKENLMDEYAELLKKYEAAQARIAELERTIDAKDAEIATAQMVIEDNAKEVYCLEAQVENLEAEAEEMKTMITMKDYERIELEEDNAMLNDKTMELMELVNRLQAENRGLRADLEGTERRVQEVEKLNADLVSDLENTEVKVWDLQEQIEVLESEADAVNRVCSAIAAKDKNLERVDVLEGELEASQQAVEYLKKVREEMAAEMEALRRENQDLTKRLIDIAFIANGGEYDSIDDGADELPF